MTAFPDHPPMEGVAPQTKQFGIILMVIGAVWFLGTCSSC